MVKKPTDSKLNRSTFVFLFLFMLGFMLASCGNPFVRESEDSQDLEFTLVFAQSRSLGVATDFDGKIVTVKLFRQSASVEPLQISSGPIQFSTTTQTPQYVVAFNNVPSSAELFLTAEISDTDSNNTVYFQGQSSIFRMSQLGSATFNLSVNPVTFPDTAKTLTSLSFRADLNSNLTQTYPTAIVGTTIEITLPDGTDRNLIPTFAHTGLAVKVSGNPITSGVTQIDFTNPVVFTIEDRQATVDTIEYTITVLLDTPPAPTPPDAPTGLTIQQVNDASLMLNWSVASGTVDGYRIYRDSVLYQTLGPGVLNYTTNTFTAGTPITYEVRAFNAEGESTPTTPVSVTPLGGFNILMPTNGANPVVLTPEIMWETSIGATSYTINVTQSGSPILTDSTGTTTYNVGSGVLDRATAYEITVNATNADFVLNSPTITVTTRGTVLYVDGSVGTDFPASGITPGSPFQTIQYALSQAIDGDEIRIAQGIYQGGFTIGKSITLNGDWNPGFTLQDPSPGTTITTPATPATSILINSSGIDVVLQDLRVELKNPLGTALLRAIDIGSSNSVILDSVRAVVVEAPNQTVSQAIFVSFQATTVTIRSSVINMAETSSVPESAGIQLAGTFAGTLTLGGTTLEEGNIFQSVTAPQMNNHIRIGTGTPATPPTITIRHNTFEALNGTGNQWQHSIYTQNTDANINIFDNTFSGHTNVGTNTIYAVRLSGIGNRDIRRNIFDLAGDTDSENYGIILDSAISGTVIIDRNKMRFTKGMTDTSTNFGLVLNRSGLVRNNILVQDGTGTGGGTFRAVTVNSANVDVFHNALINKIANAPFQGLYVNSGAVSHRFTNNLFFNESGMANAIVIVTNPTVFGEIDTNQFGGFLEENLLTGVTTLANLNLLTNANGNFLEFPSFLTPASLADPTWYKQDVLNDGSTTHAAVVLEDINGMSRGTPPKIGAYDQ